MVVCHGAFEFKENHFALCEHLCARGVAALALDMHGHGQSQGARFHVEMREWVRDIRAGLGFLSGRPEVHTGRIGAFGYSSGGTAVLEAAIADPRIRALVTLCATVRSVRDPLARVAAGLLVLLGRASRGLRRKDLRVSLVAGLGSLRFAQDDEANRAIVTDPRVRAAYAALPFPGSAESYFVHTIQRVAAIRAPTLVLHGGSDRIDPPSSARLLHRRLTCPKALRILPDNGHAAHLDVGARTVMELTGNWVKEHLK